MIATHEATYQRLVVNTRESVRRTLSKASEIERYYGSHGNNGGILQGSPEIKNAQQQYAAAEIGYQSAAIHTVAVSCAMQPVMVAVQRTRRSGKTKPEDIATAKSLTLHAPLRIKALVESLEIQTVHPFIDLIERPNPFCTSFFIKYSTVASLEATGRAFWYLHEVKVSEENPSGLQLYYIPVHWISEARNQKGRRVGWIIRPPEQTEGTPIPLNSLVEFKYPSAGDPRSAFSPLQSQSKAINTDDQLQTSQYRSMLNGIHPGVVIIANTIKDQNGVETVPVLTPDQRQELITSIHAAHGGVMHHGDPIIVDGMIKDVKPFTHTAQEMAFTESADLLQRRILSGHATSPIVLGMTEDANRASSTVANEIFYKNKVNPILTMLSETCTQFIAPRFSKNRRLYFWFEEAQARDEDLHLRQVDSLAGDCAITKNEKREAFGFPPMEGGEAVITPRQTGRDGVGRPPST